jgi:hypothetical protein
LSPDEKRDYESRLKPVRVALEAYTRLCGLRVLYTLCTLDNKYGTEEINNSAGEISAVGTKMNQLLGKSSEEVQNVIRVVWIINEKIPCDKVK